MLWFLVWLVGALYILVTTLHYIYSSTFSRSTNRSFPSPKTRQRRRRKMELEAKVGLLSSSAESESESETIQDEELMKMESLGIKAKSASPIGEPKKPSYRQYLREKRSRSREKPGSHRTASAERPFAYQTEPLTKEKSKEFDNSRSISQVHWKIHKMPKDGGSMQEEAENYAKDTPNKELVQQTYLGPPAPDPWRDHPEPSGGSLSHLATPMSSRKKYSGQRTSSDKATLRKSWLNASQKWRIQPQDDLNPSLVHGGTKQVSGGTFDHASTQMPTSPGKPMSLLSHSLHGALTKPLDSSSTSPKHSKSGGIDSYYGPTNLGVLSFATSLNPPPHSQQLRPRDSGVPKTATLLQQCQQTSLSPPKLESNSPLDLSPVKESSVKASSLQISENSAFRPIQPAKQKEWRGREILFPSTTRLSPAKRKEEEVEEPIYVSLRDVTTHPPKGNLSAALAKLTQNPADQTTSVIMQKKAPKLKKSSEATATWSGKVGIKSRPAMEVEVVGSSSRPKDEAGEKIPSIAAASSSPSVFVAKPPAPDESNLERWRARKRSMDQAKREEFGGGGRSFTTSILPLISQKSSAPLRKYHTTDDTKTGEMRKSSPPRFTDKSLGDLRCGSVWDERGRGEMVTGTVRRDSDHHPPPEENRSQTGQLSVETKTANLLQSKSKAESGHPVESPLSEKNRPESPDPSGISGPLSPTRDYTQIR